MGRNLSPILRRELENLDKDADSRKSAMKALKSYVKDLDSKAIPIFLAQVCETKETGLTSGEYTISLYEVLSRVHGTKIVPQIDNIMTTIIKTLTSSVASFALHQACSKVVPAIARYGIDPTTPENKKRQIIHSLCKPLSDSLLASQENLSSGAALCLKALVDSDNWRFASSEMVNEVCQRVAAALEKPMQTNSHMGLVMSLAEHNGLVVEAYARLLIWSGVTIMNTGASEGNSQKRLEAIQMINFLMRCLDYKCIMSELSFVIEEMEKCQTDQMAYVKGAAFEASETAKRILTEKGSKYEHRNSKRVDEDRYSFTGSPESQTMGSFGGCTSMNDSPFSINFLDSGRSVNRRHWRNGNGVVDVSLKDGLFSGGMSTPRSVIENSEHNGFSEDYADGFSGFLQKSSTNGDSRSATPSPQKSRSYINLDNIKIFTTPRKLVKSLQAPNSDLSEKQSQRFEIPSSSKFDSNPTSNQDESGISSDRQDEQYRSTSESMSSTEELCQELVPETKAKPRFFALRILSGLIVLFSVIVCFLLVGIPDEDYNLVPT
ncbi:protein SINE1-like [Cynara cardunculus var. scolymus]|uniref:Armadillo-like helical n=1 Tax=Cynara cardunculus var. scolymus TaxID=59895 RepID=A0A103YG04_CYNCS|nr:protein SINE1-like [Cynara cardunculus var. scolymus]KVI08411.1 Armadillo-like helical [Cynara cardunculus var. scolymus]